MDRGYANVGVVQEANALTVATPDQELAKAVILLALTEASNPDGDGRRATRARADIAGGGERGVAVG